MVQDLCFYCKFKTNSIKNFPSTTKF